MKPRGIYQNSYPKIRAPWFCHPRGFRAYPFGYWKGRVSILLPSSPQAVDPAPAVVGRSETPSPVRHPCASMAGLPPPIRHPCVPVARLPPPIRHPCVPVAGISRTTPQMDARSRLSGIPPHFCHPRSLRRGSIPIWATLRVCGRDFSPVRHPCVPVAGIYLKRS
jgi:hypothetical protein